jgi:hypothetical protein
MQSVYLTIIDLYTIRADIQSKGKVHPITCHYRQEGEYRFSSSLSLTSTLDGWVVNATPQPLRPREKGPVPIVQ